MRYRLLALLALMLLMTVACAAAETVPDAVLLTVNVQGENYTLGTSTTEDIVAAGWTYTVESDGTYSFFSPENESYFYVSTKDGAFSSAVTAMDLTAADGVPVSYCGYSCQQPEQMDELEHWLENTYGAQTNEEGTLNATVPLRKGDELIIETKGDRVRLTLK